MQSDPKIESPSHLVHSYRLVRRLPERQGRFGARLAVLASSGQVPADSRSLLALCHMWAQFALVFEEKPDAPLDPACLAWKQGFMREAALLGLNIDSLRSPVRR